MKRILAITLALGLLFSMGCLHKSDTKRIEKAAKNIEQAARNAAMEELRRQLDEILFPSQVVTPLANLTDEEIMELAEKTKANVKISAMPSAAGGIDVAADWLVYADDSGSKTCSDTVDTVMASWVKIESINTLAELETVCNGGAYMSDMNAATSEANFKSITNLEDADINTLITATRIDNLTIGEDNTDLNATTAVHGLLPKLDNVVTNFLNGQGGWSVPAGAGATAYDDIGDPDGAGSIAMGAHTGTYTSGTEAWGGMIIESSDADNAGDTTLLSLKHYDDFDTNSIFLSCINNSDADADNIFKVTGLGVYIGAGTPTETMTGDDLYITGLLEVDGALSASSISVAPSADPMITLTDSTHSSSGFWAVDSADADDARATFGVDDSNGDDQPYIELDGVSETVDILYSLVLSDLLTLPGQADPTTDADGEIALDLAGWGGAEFDAYEVWNGTASAYIVATTASDTPTNGQVPKWNTGGSITWEDDSTGGTTPLHLIGDPVGVTSITLADTETVTWLGSADNETFFSFQDDDVALSNLTTLIELNFSAATYDGTSNAVYLNMKDYTTTAYTFTGAAFSSYRPIVNYETNAAGAGYDAFTVSQTLGIMDGAPDFVRGFYTLWTNVNHTGGNVHAFDAEDITGDVDANEIGYRLGTGWDYSLQAESGNVQLDFDAAVIQLGADQDVTITHVADAGILMELDDYISFGDALVFIESDDDGYLDCDADTGIRLNAPITTASGTLSVTGVSTLAGGQAILTPVADTAANFAANFTGANLYGGTFVCNVTGSATIPAPVAGMNFTIITFGDIAVTVLPTAGDDILLDGVQLDDNHDALNGSTAGDIIVFQYYDADGWLATSNGWTEVAD